MYVLIEDNDLLEKYCKILTHNKSKTKIKEY